MESLLNIVYYVVPFIILLGLLVFVHEFGHFIIARLLKVKVVVFSIGFGKELWSRADSYGTKWKLSAIPLGGYCQFLGDADASSSTVDGKLDELSEEDKKGAFPLQPTWKKIAIVVAGPLFNYLFAILIFIALFYSFGRMVYPSVVGEVMKGEAADEAGIQVGDIIVTLNDKPTPDFQTLSNEVALSEGDEVKVVVERPTVVTLKADDMGMFKDKILGLISMPRKRAPRTAAFHPALPVVAHVLSGSAAERAGFKSGDVLKSINGVPIEKFEDLYDYVVAHRDDEFEIKYHHPLFLKVRLKDTQYEENGVKIKRRMLGIRSQSSMTFTETMSLGKAVKEGFKEAYDLTVTTLRGVAQMLTGRRGGKDVGGIIRIAEMSGDISKSGGLLSFIYFMALLSVNLGLVNLLPIPVLDGGSLVIYLIELVTRRELKAEVKDWIFKFGLLIILAIMVLATWNDIAHLISRWFD